VSNGWKGNVLEWRGRKKAASSFGLHWAKKVLWKTKKSASKYIPLLTFRIEFFFTGTPLNRPLISSQQTCWNGNLGISRSAEKHEHLTSPPLELDRYFADLKGHGKSTLLDNYPPGRIRLLLDLPQLPIKLFFTTNPGSIQYIAKTECGHRNEPVLLQSSGVSQCFLLFGRDARFFAGYAPNS